jgi:hydrophobe/amphiphile efflux-3 (HAE3) family protein
MSGSSLRQRLLFAPIERPFLVSAILVMISVLLALQIPKLEIDTSAEGLMAEKDPARHFYEEVKKRFGSDNLTIVVVKADDVFSSHALGTIKRLSDALERLDGVTRVESLTTVNNLKGRGDALDTDPLVGAEVPTSASALARLRAEALANRVFTGNIVATDARAAAINVYTDATPDDKQFNRRFSDGVEQLIRRESAPGLTIYQIGNAITKVTYADSLAQDLSRLLPIAVVVTFVILLVGFRTLQGVVIPMATGLLSVVWALGAMPLVGIPINTTTAVVPALLIAIGFAEDVHMISSYHERLERGMDKPAALRDMIEESFTPLVITTATTVLGFASLIITDITMLIHFGWASSIGLVANYITTQTLCPLLLQAWAVPKRTRRAAFADESGRQGAIPHLMEWLGGLILRRGRAITIVTVLVTLGSLVGWWSLRVNTDFISYFPPHSFIRERTRDLHQAVSGAINFFLVVDTGREDGVKDPDVLERIAGLQDFLASTGTIDKTVSLVDYLRTMRRELNDGRPEFERVPDTREEVAQYLLTLEGKELAKYVDFKASAANIVVRHNITSSWELSALLAQIEHYVKAHFPATVRVRPTGETILINNAADYMAVNEFTSFGLTFVVIGLIHAMLFWSLRAGFLSLVPNLIPILTNFGLMGLFRIPLNTGTALVATIAIGIAVDDTVHHMITYSRQLNIHHDQRVAMINTLRSQGRPIIYVSTALAGGFGVMVFSNFVPTMHFGVLSAVVMLVALVSELLLTPLLMHSTRLLTLWDLVLAKMDPKAMKDVALFRDFRVWEMRKIVVLGGLERHPAGTVILRRGEIGSHMYMVVKGRVKVTDVQGGHEPVVAILSPGMIFGEVAAVSDSRRTATIIADQDTELLRLDFSVLDQIRHRFPFTAAKLFRNIARILAERLSGGRPPAPASSNDDAGPLPAIDATPRGSPQVQRERS